MKQRKKNPLLHFLMKKLNYITTFLIFCMVSCRKDAPVFKWEDCPAKATIYFQDCVPYNIPPEPTGFWTGWMFQYSNPYYSFPCFNPNNANEFIYCTDINPLNIYKYNRITKTNQLLLTKHLLGPPKWGKNRWILFSDGHIWKMKDNGDSLTQITFVGEAYYPEWNYNGDKFTYEFYNGTPPMFQKIEDFNTGITDTANSLISFSGDSWQNSKNLFIAFTTGNIYYSDRGFIMIDMNSKKVTSFPLKDKYTGGSVPIWLNDHIFVFNSQTDMYVMDINSSQIKKIGETCSNEFLNRGSYSPATNELMYSIEHWNYVGNNTIEISSRIIIINLTTGAIENLTP